MRTYKQKLSSFLPTVAVCGVVVDLSSFQFFLGFFICIFVVHMKLLAVVAATIKCGPNHLIKEIEVQGNLSRVVITVILSFQR